MNCNSNPLPLDGKRILVTRSRDKAKPLVDKLTALGGVVHVVPVLSIKPVNDWTETDRAIAKIEHFDWLVFASANAVHHFLERCRTLGALARLKCKIAAIGPATAESLRQLDLSVQFTPSQFIAESFVAEMTKIEKLSGAKILWPRGNKGRMLIAEQLQAAGARVETVTCYESCPPTESLEAAGKLARMLELKELDIIIFASGESVKNFVELAVSGLENNNDELGKPDAMPRLVNEITIASIGSETSKECKRYLGKVDVEASEHTMNGIVDALVQHIRQNV